jgi:ribonucleoside-diphosphate reductase alpha chain
MATREEAYKATLAEVEDDLAANVFINKYLLVKDNNYLETTPTQIWHRLSKANAAAEQPKLSMEFSSAFYEMMSNCRFVPGGRIIYGLGNDANITLKNCYVIAIREDSIKGIFTANYEIAETFKAGGGSGTDISILRPKGSIVNNAARVSSGSVSFMHLFSQIAGTIGQHGRIGALLISMIDHHPDIFDFIKVKGDALEAVSNANISVKITDKLLSAVEVDGDFDLHWGGKVYRTIKARQLWDSIIHYAWKRAEPGLLFWDTIRRDGPAEQYEKFQTLTTNPCGEATLSDGDSCNLGSLNFGRYVRNSFEKNADFDIHLFKNDIRKSVRFLDNIITLDRSPLPFQQWANDHGRRLGLGIMGMADAFMRLGIKYDSEEAYIKAEEIMNVFRDTSYEASCELAKEKGSFSEFDAKRHMNSPFIQRLPDHIKSMIEKTGIRNVAIHAIAPTGSLSCIAKCSGAIEPVFKVRYFRKTNLGTAKEVKEFEVLHQVAKEYVEKFGNKELPSYFMGAHEVPPMARIKLQSMVQKYIDQAISNTVNLPENCTERQISDIYFQAWKNGLKGITVYREGSRQNVLSSKSSKDATDKIVVHNAPKRPDSLDGVVHVIKPNGKRYAVFVGLMGERPYEVFALDHKLTGLEDGMRGKIVKEKADKTQNYYHFESGPLMVRKLNNFEDDEASLITRMISTALRHGTPLEFLIDQINKSKAGFHSFARAIARALSLYLKQEEVAGKFKCHKCGSTNIKWSGTCCTCLDCQESKCS